MSQSEMILPTNARTYSCPGSAIVKLSPRSPDGDDTSVELSAMLRSLSVHPHLLYHDRRSDDTGVESGSKADLWNALDNHFNGPDYDRRSCPWLLLPILSQRRPEIRFEHNRMMSALGSKLPHEVVVDTYSHVYRVRALTGMSFYPDAIIQGEYAHLADRLHNLYPTMLVAVRDSDLPQMQFLIEAAHELIRSMQELVEIEKATREAVGVGC